LATARQRDRVKPSRLDVAGDIGSDLLAEKIRHTEQAARADIEGDGNAIFDSASWAMNASWQNEKTCRMKAAGLSVG
jgi:hypothetical protein